MVSGEALRIIQHSKKGFDHLNRVVSPYIGVYKNENIATDITTMHTRTRQRAEAFKRNLRFLLECQSMSLHQASIRFGVSYDLLKRWNSRGLAYPNKRTEPILKNLAAFFGFHSVENLWTDLLSHKSFRGSLRAAFFSVPNDPFYRERFLEAVRFECNELEKLIPKEQEKSPSGTTQGAQTGV